MINGWIILILIAFQDNDRTYYEPIGDVSEVYVLRENGKLKRGMVGHMYMKPKLAGIWSRQGDTLSFYFKSKHLEDEQFLVFENFYFETLIPLDQNFDENKSRIDSFEESEFCNIEELNEMDSFLENTSFDRPNEHPRTICYSEYLENTGVLFRVKDVYRN